MPFRIASFVVLALLSCALFFAERAVAPPLVRWMMLAVFAAGIAITVWAQFGLPGWVAFLLGVAGIGVAIVREPNLMVWFYPGDGGELYAVAAGRQALCLILTGVWGFVIYGAPPKTSCVPAT